MTAASPSALAVEESKLQARRKLRGGWRHGAEDEHEPSGVLPAGRRRRRQASSEQHLPQRRAGVVRRHEALALRLTPRYVTHWCEMPRHHPETLVLMSVVLYVVHDTDVYIVDALCSMQGVFREGAVRRR